jgi:signal transduction histidine kinase/CheY-like chemotaxis protein
MRERVLICAPIGRDAELARDLLARDGIAAAACPSIEQLCAEVGDDAGALLIGEEALDADAVRRLVETLDAQPPWSDIPVIVLAGGEFSMSAVRPLNVLGPLRNVMILERPVRRLVFARTVAVALRSRRRQFELRAHLDERAELLRHEQRVNRMKDEFLMTVSHELRTPLNAIYGWARMLATGQIRDEQRARAIEVIERNAAAQAQLVNDLLDVSRAISGKVRLNVQSVDPRHVVMAAVDTVQPAADAKNVRIQTVLDPGAGPIAGDRDRLQQIVWNLLSNAIKFTPKDGRVQVRLERVDSHAEIVVSDTGTGIDPEFLPHVFERFRQGDAGTTRQTAGLGLGLAIVRHLVELHGGSVHATSGGRGRGATFRIRLPLTIVHHAVVDPETAPDPSPERESRRSACPLDALRVLIVDDEPQARELFATIVENAGADIRVAASADEATAIIFSWSPHVVLSDIEMPGKDGYTFMEALDRNLRDRTVTIAVTAHSRPEDRLHALEVGFQWHVSKPVEPAELVAVIASLAERLRQ